MRSKKLKRALASTSGLLALSIALPAAAQTAPPGTSKPEDLEEIVVTGLIGSLQRNLDMKREAPGVVDVITSEDIGKFPDSNVAASLQRVPGVSIQRAGTRGEPERHHRARLRRRLQRNAVRRPPHLDRHGRTLGRLQHRRRRLRRRADGHEDARRHAVEQFDRRDGQHRVPEAPRSPRHALRRERRGFEQEEAGSIQPTGGLLFSDTFADDTIGILVDAIYTKRDTDTNRVFVSGWEGGKFAPCQLTATCNPGELDDADKTIVGWWQQQYGAEQSQVTDERIDGRIAFQWRPSDSTLLTIDDNFSRQKIETDTYGFGLWFGINDLRSVVLDDNGTVIDFARPARRWISTAASRIASAGPTRSASTSSIRSRTTSASTPTSRMPRAS